MSTRMAAVALALGMLTSCGGHPFGHGGVPASHQQADAAARQAAKSFLDQYVDDTGRVVRHDQGGDTVSEGQGYALLLAVAIGDRDRFRLIWTWTRRNLQRDDHLFSWHWDSKVVGDQPAADADMDIARALVLAAARFGESRWKAEGISVGRSVLGRETAVVNGKRVLLPGPWANQTPPLMINASYVSPVATQLLSDASQDPRWNELADGSRAMVTALSRNQLPPDWAVMQSDGSVHASTRDAGGQPRFGYDAVRVPIRLAESCTPADQQIAASMATRLAASHEDVMTHAVGWVARAASEAAAGQSHESAVAVSKAAQAVRSQSTYYGDAWNALGRFMLLDRRLGGCPPKG